MAINIVASATAEKLLISKINSDEKLLELGDDEATEELKMLKASNGNSFLASEEALRHSILSELMSAAGRRTPPPPPHPPHSTGS